MKHALILFLFIGLKLEAQGSLKNRISFQTGPFHYFFDESRVINTGTLKYPPNGVFNASFGAAYQHQLPTNRWMSFELMRYQASYIYATPQPAIFRTVHRQNIDINACFLTPKPLHPKLNVLYGAGPSIRFANYESDAIATNPETLYWISMTYNNINIGANGRLSLEYTPVKWVTLFTQLQMAAYVYARNIRFTNKFEVEPYFKPTKFNLPSRFDLSLRFGIGINF
jgi:hypothetical protein